MLALPEFHPHFLAFAEVHACHQRGEMLDSEFALHAQAFTALLQRLQQRLNWELPLLAGMSGAQGAIFQVVERLTVLTQLVQSSPHEVSVPASLQAGEQALQQVSFLLHQLPFIVDVAVVNELLILASNEGEVDLAPVQQRLPLLLQWLADLENGWKTFLLLFPQRQSLVDKALYIVQALKGAAGGIHLVLEGEDPQGLRSALQIMVNALQALAPMEETRYLEETEQLTLSTDLRLERGSRLVARLGTMPPEYQLELQKWLTEKAQSLADLRSWLFWAGMEPAVHTDEVERLLEKLNLLATNVSQFHAFDHSFLLKDLEQWRGDFEELTKKLQPQEIPQE